jgi:hypothetical protein
MRGHGEPKLASSGVGGPALELIPRRCGHP